MVCHVHISYSAIDPHRNSFVYMYILRACVVEEYIYARTRAPKTKYLPRTPFTIDHIISYHIISYHIISYHIISYHIISYHIISYHIISYHIISYHIISYHIISYHIISYHIISYHIISYHIISYHIISTASLCLIVPLFVENNKEARCVDMLATHAFSVPSHAAGLLYT